MYRFCCLTVFVVASFIISSLSGEPWKDILMFMMLVWVFMDTCDIKKDLEEGRYND